MYFCVTLGEGLNLFLKDLPFSFQFLKMICKIKNLLRHLIYRLICCRKTGMQGSLGLITLRRPFSVNLQISNKTELAHFCNHIMESLERDSICHK